MKLHINSLIACGFSEGHDEFNLPEGLFSEFEGYAPQAIAGSRGLIIGLSLFLGSSIGSWAVGKSMDYLYDEKLKPALNVLEQKLTEDQEICQSGEIYCFQYGVWFDVDRIYMQLNIYVKSPEELSAVKELIQRAQEKTQNIIDNNKFKDKVIIFTIKNMEFVGEPQISSRLSRS